MGGLPAFSATATWRTACSAANASGGSVCRVRSGPPAKKCRYAGGGRGRQVGWAAEREHSQHGRTGSRFTQWPAWHGMQPSGPAPPHLRRLQHLEQRVGVWLGAGGGPQAVHQPRQQLLVLRNVLLTQVGGWVAGMGCRWKMRGLHECMKQLLVLCNVLLERVAGVAGVGGRVSELGAKSGRERQGCGLPCGLPTRLFQPSFPVAALAATSPPHPAPLQSHSAHPCEAPARHLQPRAAQAQTSAPPRPAPPAAHPRLAPAAR